MQTGPTGRVALRILATSLILVALSPTSASAAPALKGRITVFAASSLSDVFSVLGAKFQGKHPLVEISFSFASSSTLAIQINNGAPADVFASASSSNMEQVISSKAATITQIFAKNRMAIAVPAANPAKIRMLTDLAKPKIKVAVCQLQAPCGSAALAIFKSARLSFSPITFEPDVKAVLSKVILGEVDAGLVYASDIFSAKKSVIGISIPISINSALPYSIAVLNSSTQQDVAKAFVDYVLSGSGRVALQRAGFLKP